VVLWDQFWRDRLRLTATMGPQPRALSLYGCVGIHALTQAEALSASQPKAGLSAKPPNHHPSCPLPFLSKDGSGDDHIYQRTLTNLWLDRVTSARHTPLYERTDSAYYSPVRGQTRGQEPSLHLLPITSQLSATRPQHNRTVRLRLTN